MTAPASKPFGLADVEAVAFEIAQKPYESPDGKIPAILRSLTLEQRQAIRYNSEKTLWKSGDSPFSIRFHHPGFIYDRVASIYTVDDGNVTPFRFSSELFRYGDEALAAQMQTNGLGFAGFSIMSSSGIEYAAVPGSLEDENELAIFLGASYFRSKGRHSSYGLSARGLALNTALPDGEEFPYFRQFWLVKPKPEDAVFVLYAITDSPSMVGAFKIIVTPGTSTVMDVEARFYPRTGVRVPAKIGLAPLTSMFLYSETDNGKPGDYRPEIHNSDGMLFLTDDDRWYWCPLANPERLMVNTFPMANPRGFGLQQRDDDFDHYQDLTARYDRRPSLWIEPVGDWGGGRLELVLIPGSADHHGNVVSYWVPDAPAAAVSPANGGNGNGAKAVEQGIKAAYRMYWMTPGVTPHELGRATATRMVRPPQSDSVSFIIDFEGEALKALHADVGLTSVVETPEQAPVLDKRLVKNQVTGGWRLFLTIRVPRRDGVMQSLFTARDGVEPLRFKATLKRGENLPDPLTETWVYHLSY